MSQMQPIYQRTRKKNYTEFIQTKTPNYNRPVINPQGKYSRAIRISNPDPNKISYLNNYKTINIKENIHIQDQKNLSRQKSEYIQNQIGTNPELLKKNNFVEDSKKLKIKSNDIGEEELQKSESNGSNTSSYINSRKRNTSRHKNLETIQYTESRRLYKKDNESTDNNLNNFAKDIKENMNNFSKDIKENMNNFAKEIKLSLNSFGKDIKDNLNNSGKNFKENLQEYLKSQKKENNRLILILAKVMGFKVTKELFKEDLELLEEI